MVHIVRTGFEDCDRFLANVARRNDGEGHQEAGRQFPGYKATFG